MGDSIQVFRRQLLLAGHPRVLIRWVEAATTLDSTVPPRAHFRVAPIST